VLLKLENIGKIYDSNDILTIGIRGVNLELDYNEFVTIEGESGSGKSTLLNVIAANDTYEEGELWFNGMETSHYSESDWEKYRERNIAMIFQDFNIIENLTVLENVELALLRMDDVKERRRIAKELIGRVGLTKQMNQRGSKLSGGEKQRTVIARALAKDAPVILADEPTGNLDVKASKEVAALLKEVSKDKLVIVVTHNPEFFKQYATRRVRVYDGKISEDRVIEKPAPVIADAQTEEIHTTKWLNFKNTLHIGVLNYKSRPKFTLMMTFALFVCAITMFLVISLFGQSLIQPTMTTLDNTGVEGKVILSNRENDITQEQLDEVAGSTKAGFFLLDRELSEFTVSIPRTGGMLQAYDVTCLYSPYEHNLEQGEAVLVLPSSVSGDADAIRSAFLNAGVGIYEISVENTLEAGGIYLYLACDDLNAYGEKMQALYSGMTLGTDETTVYTFEIDESLLPGQVDLVNSNYYAADGRTVVFAAKTDKAYTVMTSNEKNEEISGLIVQMNEEDYAAMFARDDSSVQSVLYYGSDEAAADAVAALPAGYMGMLSTTQVYVQDAMDIFTENVLWYIALIAVSLVFAMLISVIFMRSVKIYQADFAVYRTLGISRKISSRSLYIQMLLIFLPTLLLLPVISLIATVIPGSSLAFISAGNYFFIEAMMLLIVEFVAFGFNKSINSQSIRKSLRRGSK
jgi:ABC-type transport system, ATP-binding and permease components